MKVSAFKRRSNTGTKWGKLRLEVLEGRLLPDSAFASLGHVLSSVSLSVHDATPHLSINDVSVVEGNNGLTSALFTVSLSNPSQDTVAVDFTTADGTASASSGDYVTNAGTLSFAPGTTVQTLTILVNGDT